MVCMDTDFMIGLLRRDPSARAKFDGLIQDGAELCTTPVNAGELYQGAYVSNRVPETLLSVKGILDRIGLLDFGLDAAELYGKLSKDLASKGSNIGDFDLLIACIALAHNEVLLTKNRKHFERVQGLVIDSW